MQVILRPARRRLHVTDRNLRASDFAGNLGEANNPDWKTIVFDSKSGSLRGAQRLHRLPLGRGGQVEPAAEERCRPGRHRGRTVLPGQGRRETWSRWAFRTSRRVSPSLLYRNVPVRRVALADGCETVYVASVFDLQVAQYGIDRGLGGANVADVLRRRRRCLHAGLGREGHRREGRRHRAHRPRVRRQRRQDAAASPWSSWVRRSTTGTTTTCQYRVDHEPAAHVRLRRPERRRLGALRRPGEAAAAGRLGADRLRA